eukprot:10409145-Karenia_brevis.AAC.1
MPLVSPPPMLAQANTNGNIIRYFVVLALCILHSEHGRMHLHVLPTIASHGHSSVLPMPDQLH